MKEFRILILDDNPKDSLLLKQAIFSNGYQWKIDIQQTFDKDKLFDYDGAFVDIELNGQNGFEVGNAIRSKKDIPIIFLSSYEQYALDGYQYDVLYFLSKHKLTDYLESALVKVHQAMLENALFTTVYDEDDIEKEILFKDIIYMSTNKNYVNFYCANDKIYRDRITLVKLKDRLPDYFIFVNSGILVNVYHIIGIDKLKLIVKLDNDDSALISRAKLNTLLKLYKEKMQ